MLYAAKLIAEKLREADEGRFAPPERPMVVTPRADPGNSKGEGAIAPPPMGIASSDSAI
jgi:hypothetical protein